MKRARRTARSSPCDVEHLSCQRRGIRHDGLQQYKVDAREPGHRTDCLEGSVFKHLGAGTICGCTPNQSDRTVRRRAGCTPTRIRCVEYSWRPATVDRVNEGWTDWDASPSVLTNRGICGSRRPLWVGRVQTVLAEASVQLRAREPETL